MINFDLGRTETDSSARVQPPRRKPLPGLQWQRPRYGGVVE
nr:MAG TPA: hypothetical protein [Caudoviricetes sp.]